MKYPTLLFAILAAVPQALRQIALLFLKSYKCAAGSEICLIHGINRAPILNMLAEPNWFNTIGLRIGLAGTALGMVGMYLVARSNRRKAEAIINRAHEHQVHARAGGASLPTNGHSGLDYSAEGQYIGGPRRLDEKHRPRR